LEIFNWQLAPDKSQCFIGFPKITVVRHFWESGTSHSFHYLGIDYVSQARFRSDEERHFLWLQSRFVIDASAGYIS
jgi:hypothetical protein